MGSEIGWISLGIRLLSLGGNLSPHIPDTNLNKNKSESSSNDVPLGGADFKVASNTVPTHSPKVTPNERAKSKSNDNFINDTSGTNLKSEKVSVSTETDLRIQDHDTRKVSRQTGHHYRRNQRNSEYASVSNEGVDDLFMTNTHVPPPLYFNSDNDHQEKQDKTHKSFCISYPAQTLL